MTPDEQLLATINGSLSRYKVDYNDSTALQNKKMRQFTAQVALINKRYAGKRLSFKQMCVSDVEPEHDLTPYGRQQAKKIVKVLQSDAQGRQILDLGRLEENPLLQLMVAAALASCKKCMRETGRYAVKFAFGCADGGDSSISGTSSVEKLVSSESEALKYKKGEVYPVSGIVRAIKFDSGVHGVETRIFLK